MLLNQEPQLAYVQLAYLAIMIGLALLYREMLKNQLKNIAKDDKPTTLATRGSFTNFVLGTRRVGPIFCFAGDRQTKKESSKGKGDVFGPPEQTVFYESGWHVLCPGPVKALHKIYQNGKVIFDGPITRDGYPSGSRLLLGNEGYFEIYWGEEDQPINTILGDPERVDVESRWPYMCYIHWIEKRLGPSPNWPLLDYVIEVDLPDDILTLSEKEFPPTLTPTGHVVNVNSAANPYASGAGINNIVVNGPEWNRIPPGEPGSNWATAGKIVFRLWDSRAEWFEGAYMRFDGNAYPDGDYKVLGAFIIKDGDPIPNPPADPSFADQATWFFEIETHVFLAGGLTGADTAGTIESLHPEDDGGYNPAHVIAQLLFGTWPLGHDLDTEPWDLDSLEDLGVLCETEGPGGTPIFASVFSQDGENLDAILGALLIDLGVMLTIDPANGKMKFVPVREEIGPIPTIPSEMILNPKPLIQTELDDRKSSRLVFSFQDREYNYRDSTISVDDDGQAAYGTYPDAKKSQITSTTHFPTAASWAERRAQEELSQLAVAEFVCSRAARKLKPGDARFFEGYPQLYRIMEVRQHPLNSKVTIQAMPDFYTVPLSTYTNGRGMTPPPLLKVDPDNAVTFLEIPSQINQTGKIQLGVLRIRSHIQVFGAHIYVSNDNVTYVYLNKVNGSETGGRLDADFSEDEPNYLATGPVINVDGPESDMEALNLLTPLNDTNWRLGRIIAVVGNEIWFVKDIVMVAAGQWRLDGVLRARFDTHKATHAEGTAVFLFDAQQLDYITDIIFQPLTNIFIKVLPIAASGTLALDDAFPHYKVIVGKGIAPMQPWALMVTAPDEMVHIYRTGDDIDFQWGYRSSTVPKTGAGQQPAGTAITPSPVQGFFRLEFDDGSTQFTREIVGSLTYTLTNAELVAEFGLEPASFDVSVRNIHGSYLSPVFTITINKIT